MTADTHHSPKRLHFSNSETPQPLAELTVKADTSTTLLGRPATVCIIGESHYLSCPPLRYFELCSCAPLRTDAVTISLIDRATHSFSFENELISADTVVTIDSMAPLPAPETVTLAHRFGERAWTLLDCQEGSVETYHSYPEHDRLVRSQTTLRANDSL